MLKHGQGHGHAQTIVPKHLSESSLRRRALPVPPPASLSTSMADSPKLFPKATQKRQPVRETAGVVVVVCVCGGGGGADRVYMESLCRLTMTHATNSGGRTPGSQTPGVPVTLEPSMTKNSSSSRAHLALNVRMDGARKMASQPPKKPSHRHNRQKRKLSTRTVRTLSMNCKCRTSAVFCTVTTTTCCCRPTGMSTTLSNNWRGSQRFSQ